jgi:DNA polymerase III subunit alpha
MYGVIEFFNAAQAAGIKPIIGVEAYMAQRGMKDRDAKLDKSSTSSAAASRKPGRLPEPAQDCQRRSVTDGFYYYPRVDHEFLKSTCDGLIATSGCMSAEIPRALRDRGLDARRLMDWYYEVFGKKTFM